MSPNLPSPDETLVVKPLGAGARPATTVDLHPSAGAIVKDEPGTLIWREALSDGTVAALKLYRRGYASWLRSRLTAFRACHEFKGLRQLLSLGIPCSEPLFWSHGRFGTHGWGELLATRWIADSQSLADVLAGGARSEELDLTPIFAFAGRMHDAGLRHGTLLSRNILVRPAASGPQFVFIDMPRFHRFPRRIRGTRMARYDLLYLCDSLARHGPPDRIPSWLTAYGMSPADQDAFLLALGGFRNTSLLRRVIGAEFNLRHLLFKR